MRTCAPPEEDLGWSPQGPPSPKWFKAVTFSSAKLGGHQEPFWKGRISAITKGLQRIALGQFFVFSTQIHQHCKNILWSPLTNTPSIQTDGFVIYVNTISL